MAKIVILLAIATILYASPTFGRILLKGPFTAILNNLEKTPEQRRCEREEPTSLFTVVYRNTPARWVARVVGRDKKNIALLVRWAKAGGATLPELFMAMPEGWKHSSLFTEKDVEFLGREHFDKITQEEAAFLDQCTLD